MLKLLAVLRTLFLVFIIGYTVRATPFIGEVSRTFDEQYARCATGLGLLLRAAWIAIAWIAFAGTALHSRSHQRAKSARRGSMPTLTSRPESGSR